jgi:hypothetical protein
MSNAWHFISPASRLLHPQEKSDILGLFEWILNQGTNVGSRWCGWWLAFQKHMFVVGSEICIQTDSLRHWLWIFLQEQAHSDAPQVGCRDRRQLTLVYSNVYPTRCNVTQFPLSGNCSTCFGLYHHLSSGAQTTVSAAPGICQTVTATCRNSSR